MIAQLAADAAVLRSLHRPGDPLVLPNAWDVASAKMIEATGFPVIATSSSAVAEVLGYEDDDSMPPDEAFQAVARIRGAVGIPVTADLEAGYELSPEEFVTRLLQSGAVGCNLEDTDHHGEARLLDATVHAERLSAIKAAARKAGVDIVLNARVDVPLAEPARETLGEAVRRGRLYFQAGADCVYPVYLRDEAAIAGFVAEVGAPVNILLRSGDRLEVARLSRLGVARLSMGGGLMRKVQQALKESLARLAQP